MRNAYDSEDQAEQEYLQLKPLIGESTVSDYLQMILESPQTETFSKIEIAIQNMLNIYDSKEIGNTIHNFSGLLDFSYEYSKELKPNPFFELNEKLALYRKKYPRSKPLTATKIFTKKGIK
jgi:hypothetical protein